MATSLAEQLQKLSVPQSSIYKEEKKKPSLLFNPKEAGQKDRDTFYEIGISGLRELISLYEGFRFYEDTLFNQSSKDFERAVQTKETNDNLNNAIEKFLRQLSPYLLLQSSHKALEWLVNRYHIHDYNQDAIMALILPYHDTKIFTRFVQLMDLKHASNRWNWLQPIQKPGVPLAKQVLYNQCASNLTTLSFIAKSTLQCVKEFGERASQLTTLFAFFCSTTVGTIDSCKRVREALINALLPTLMRALDSPVIDFRASAYVILGYLTTKVNLKEDTLNEIIAKLLNSEFDLTSDMVLLTNLIYSTQEHMKKISEDVVYNISVAQMNTLCIHLKNLINLKINVQPFVSTFIQTTLPMIQVDSEEFRRTHFLPELLIEEVNLKSQQPENIIKCVIDAYGLNNDERDGNESDIEIIGEDNLFSSEIIQWYSMFLKSLEQKYPEHFDNVIKQELNSKSKISKKRHSQLVKVLGFKPAVSHKLGDTYLFENLNHVNPELRVQAIQYVSNEFSTLKTENIEYLKESIVERFNDDNPEVIKVALNIPTEYLNEVLNNIDLTNAFVNIVSKNMKNYKKWKPIVLEAIKKFCSLYMLPVNQNTVLGLLPHLIPSNNKSALQSINIIKSVWGQKFDLTEKVAKLMNTNSIDKNDICENIYKVLCVERSVDSDDILDFNLINKDNTLDICFYLLLKACTLHKAPVEEVTNYLNILLQSFESRAIVPKSNNIGLSGETLPQIIKLGRKDQIPFELVEYVLTRIIEDSNFDGISKPWCNICLSPSTGLFRRLFEICLTGCFIKDYNKSYLNLLQRLLKRVFLSGRENMEFIANVASGHILYAADPEDVISPELQLRCLKLFCIGINENASWIHNSEVVITMILFNLNHPLAIIRKCTLNVIENILQNDPDKNNIYVQLLKQLLDHKEELLLDHEQIQQVLNTMITINENKTFKKNCLNKLVSIITGDSPAHVKSELLKLLSQINNANVFSLLIPAGKKLESILERNTMNTKFKFDIYESKVLKHLFERINENTVTSFEKEDIWSCIVFYLKEYKDVILEADKTATSPTILIMKEINEEMFKRLSDERCKEVVELICAAGAFSNNPDISTVAAKSMKKINLHFPQFKPVLEHMLNVQDPVANVPKKKKSTVSMLSYQVTETDEWKMGVTLLEYVQSKKKLNVDISFVTLLFQLLKKCLRFEEQSYVEYTKQLILSSLWFYCKKFVNDSDIEQVKSLKSIFDIELIVQCIRGTQNPQTHNHALILLSHAAYMLPEQVLHHTMEIFTFMGSSVLRHDDAYSFQIITKIIETLVPILVKLDRDVEEYSEKEFKQLQNRVVPVLRIFADVVLHVPEHRRLPLYKKLIETLGSSQFLWVFLALLLETHISHWNDNKGKAKKSNRNLADQELPINRLDFGQNILLEFPPEIVLENFIKLIMFIKSLPDQKDENSMDTGVDPCEIFSLNGHTAVQLRHYKYILITFMNTCLSSSRFIEHTSIATDIKAMETNYKTLIVNILTFVQKISKITDDKTAKYWRVMLHHSYDLLDHTNNLLSAPMFLSVIRGLLKHTLHTVRRKSMELLNSKIQYSPEFFSECDKDLMYSLLPSLLDIIKTIENKDESTTENIAQELELNQQTALLSLKLLIRALATENPEPFKQVLEQITEYTCNQNISGNVMASIVLCLAELCSNLKAHSLVSLRKFMPALIKVLKKQRKAETPELILLSTVTAISKIVESLPLFLSPYLQKILFEYSILLAKWQGYDQDEAKVSAIVAKLINIRKKIAGSIPPRVLIPVVNRTHDMLLQKEEYNAIGPIMSVLADSFANVTTADFSALQQDLNAFFLSALQLRSDAVERNVDNVVIKRAEDEIVNALVCLVLKLSETSFRPFYFKIYDWAIRSNVEGHKDRTITFYRLSSAIADKLKGLFVLFAGHFIKNASELLDSCNVSKTEDLFFDSEEKCSILVEYILKTLRVVFLYDSQNFINKDRFETLMQPMVDQLENTLLGLDELKARASKVLLPCISQFAVATADDSLWKLLNYQILLKTRHNDAEIRLLALECLVSMATQLGNGWLPLLAESVPFLAELLEDGDPKIESTTKDAIRQLEHILGEPLEKYF